MHIDEKPVGFYTSELRFGILQLMRRTGVGWSKSPNSFPQRWRNFCARRHRLRRRDVAEDTKLNGSPIQVGNMALLSFPSANRDASVFPDAERVVLDRKPNRHLAFGFGIHNCLGANLARIEITVALQQWMAKNTQLQTCTRRGGQLVYGTVRGPRHLPLVLILRF